MTPVPREYAGIDLHRRRSVIIRKDANGDLVSKVHIDNDPVSLAQAMAAAGLDGLLVGPTTIYRSNRWADTPWSSGKPTTARGAVDRLASAEAINPLLAMSTERTRPSGGPSSPGTSGSRAGPWHLRRNRDGLGGGATSRRLELTDVTERRCSCRSRAAGARSPSDDAQQFGALSGVTGPAILRSSRQVGRRLLKQSGAVRLAQVLPSLLNPGNPCACTGDVPAALGYLST